MTSLHPNPDDLPADIRPAFMGVAGRFVELFRGIFRPVPVLFHFLALVGAYAGRETHATLCGREIRPNVLMAGVGVSNLYLGAIHREFAMAFASPIRIVVGANALKLIFEVRDHLIRPERVPTEPDNPPWFTPTLIDDGIPDKRVVIVEPELLAALSKNGVGPGAFKSFARRGFSGLSLESWIGYQQGGVLRCECPHVSVLTTVSPSTRFRTCENLLDLFLFFRLEPVKPFFTNIEIDSFELGMVLGEFVERLPCCAQRVEVNKDAAAILIDTVAAFSVGQDSVSTEQLLKLAMIYSVLEGTAVITVDHARAAAAVFRHSWSIRRECGFGLLIDSVQEKLVEALREASSEGLTTTALDRRLANVPAEDIRALLNDLAKAQKVRCEVTKTGGRDSKRWIWIPDDEEAPY